ncbi:MAG TPA: hypothetical protein VGC36_09690 [Rhizomicrobium sp.]
MEFSFDREGYRYGLRIDLGAFDETAFSIAITATRTPIRPRDRLYEFSVKAEVSIVARDDVPFLVVTIEGVELFAEPVDEVLGTSDVMNMIPAHLYGVGDPFIGCLVRAGLSASIDQARRCWRGSRGEEGLRRRFARAFACIRDNLANLGVRAAIRAGWCIARNGS